MIDSLLPKNKILRWLLAMFATITIVVSMIVFTWAYVVLEAYLAPRISLMGTCLLTLGMYSFCLYVLVNETK